VLRREVESLLSYEDAAGSFLESPAMEVSAKGMRREPSTALVGRTLGHYRVESMLGSGGMGEVYLARDPRLERAVALKILPRELALESDRMQRFIREARAASALNHPNVATIHDIGESDDVRFIVMEYVEGETIAARLGGPPPTVAEIVDVAMQVADALDAAHAKGITHRDIKPANLMLTPRGQVKVLDFGIAKLAGPAEGPAKAGHYVRHEPDRGTRVTRAGMVLGSVPYMSPEQVSGRDVDHRSDLFSLGVTLYEVATGRLPFRGATSSETRDQILRAQPEPMTGIRGDIPPELERIAHKCLEKDVARRYQSARELLGDLQQLKRRSDDITRAPGEGTRLTNLPALLTSFVGRRGEMEEVRRLIGGTRLLTLTGAGGCGKTRLALQVASEMLDDFRDGVWVVDLSPLSDPGLIPHTLAAAVGVREGASRSLSDALAEYFRSRRVLVVLDNCEHLIAACAQLVEPLLRAAPALHVLATSREGLGITGEAVWRVPSLSTPGASVRVNPDALTRYEAVRLFADRAAAVRPAFVITNENATAVADICRRLDGIPLAIELAAARLNVLPVDQINDRLNDRFRLLTGGSRTAVARQRTLEAAIDWSYDLLSDQERTLLCRLSVFPGGWTLDAAEQVCSTEGIEEAAVLDLLSSLVDKSLVNVEDDALGRPRYRCLETVRQYGRERLIRSGDAEPLRDAHLRFFASFALRAEPELLKADQVLWLKRVHIEHDNLRSALEWCVDTRGGSDAAIELASAMQWFWVKRGYLGEGRHWLERALASGNGSPDIETKALAGLALLTYFLGDYAAARLYAERGVALGREAHLPGAVALGLGVQALAALETGDTARSSRLAHESREAAIAGGEPWLQGPGLECLAYEAVHEDDFERAAKFGETALELARVSEDAWSIAICLSDLALFRNLQGRYVEAEQLCAESLTLAEAMADRLLTGFPLSVLAGAQAGQGRHERAARLWGAMHALLESVAAPLQHTHKVLTGDRYISRAEAALGQAAFQRALGEGRAMSWS
jgi:non-specific serine/threonine protein kinase